MISWKSYDNCKTTVLNALARYVFLAYETSTSQTSRRTRGDAISKFLFLTNISKILPVSLIVSITRHQYLSDFNEFLQSCGDKAMTDRCYCTVSLLSFVYFISNPIQHSVSRTCKVWSGKLTHYTIRISVHSLSIVWRKFSAKLHFRRFFSDILKKEKL